MSLLDFFKPTPEIRIDFNDGPCVEIVENADLHRVVMLDDNTIVHEAQIQGNQWTRAHRKYYANWKLQVFRNNAKKVFEHRFDLKNKTIRINIDSKSLGDTLAWIPQIQRFAEQHPNSRIYVSQFWKSLFDEPAYPKLNFIDPNSRVENCYATYNIGYYFTNTPWHHPSDPRTLPLGQVAADILGIPFFEDRPVLTPVKNASDDVQRPYVCIGTASTAQCKFWLYPQGWQIIVDYLKQNGLETMVIQKEDSTLNRIIDRTGDRPITERIEQLSNCEFFIGLGSGLSWLAWAVGKPVVLIAGFSEPYTEFTQNCERVFNSDACTGCWNDTQYSFDRGDWNWCPRHKGTNREFECSKSITPEMVIRGINSVMTLNNSANYNSAN